MPEWLIRLLAGGIVYDKDDEGAGGGDDDDDKKIKKPVKVAKVVADDDDDDDEDDRKPTLKEVLRLRAESKKRRLENKDLATKLATEQADRKKAIDDAVAAALVAAGTSTKDAIAASEEAANKRVIRTSLKEALKAAKVVDEETGLKLIDASGISVNADGDVVGLTEAVAKLKTDKAFLFTAGSTTNTKNGAPSPLDGQKVDVRTMDDAAFKAHAKTMGINVLA